MNRPARLVVGVAACATLLVAGSALPVAAAHVTRTTHVADMSFRAPGTAVTTRAAFTSHYLAGYTAISETHVTTMAVKTLTVPSLECTSPDFQGVGLGAGSELSAGVPSYLGLLRVACLEPDDPLYAIDAVVGETDNSDQNVKPGDRIQIAITLDCHPAPDCIVTVDVIDLDTLAHVHTREEINAESATYGAFPLYGTSDPDPSPVPAFASARFNGCRVNDALLTHGERINRKRDGSVEIKAGTLNNGSFALRYVNP